MYNTYIHILSSSSNYRPGAQGGSGDGGSPDLSMDAHGDSELSQLAHRMACMGFSSSQAFFFSIPYRSLRTRTHIHALALADN